MVIKEQCPGLRKLYIENSTKNNETKSAATYSEFVFRMVRNHRKERKKGKKERKERKE